MNIIWTIIILFSFVFAISTGNLNNLINSIFNVPKESLSLLVSIGSLIVIYNGVFQIAIDSGLIKKISFIFRGIVKKVFNDIDEEVVMLICANICANILGLGVASTPIALNVMSHISHEDKVNNNILCLVGINLSSFTLFPLTILTIRNTYQGSHSFFIWLSIIFISFVTTLFSIVLAKKWRFR